MSDDDTIFLATDLAVDQVGARLTELLELEPIPEPSEAADEVGLRGRAGTADGWLGFLVHRNWHAEVDPAPDEVQAIDAYSIQIDIWYGAKDEEIQRREARQVFDRLVAALRDVPALLTHNLTSLAAAYLPGAGLHEFESGTTMDAPDEHKWRPWVSEPTGR